MRQKARDYIEAEYPKMNWMMTKINFVVSNFMLFVMMIVIFLIFLFNGTYILRWIFLILFSITLLIRLSAPVHEVEQ